MIKTKRILQKKYIITLSKIFEYPSCVIDRRNTLNDLYNKSKQDFLENIERNGLNLNEFQVNVQSEIPYEFKPIIRDGDRPVLDQRVNSSNMEFYIREFVVSDIELKYGVLNPETNPSIYTQVSHPIFDEDDIDHEEPPIDHEISYELIDVINNYWNERYQYYINILRKKGI